MTHYCRLVDFLIGFVVVIFLDLTGGAFHLISLTGDGGWLLGGSLKALDSLSDWVLSITAVARTEEDIAIWFMRGGGEIAVCEGEVAAGGVRSLAGKVGIEVGLGDDRAGEVAGVAI